MSVVYGLACMLLHRFCNWNQSLRTASEEGPAGWELGSAAAGALVAEDWAAAGREGPSNEPSQANIEFQNRHTWESIAAPVQNPISAEAHRLKKISDSPASLLKYFWFIFFFMYIFDIGFCRTELRLGLVLRVLQHPLLEGYGAVGKLLN